MKKWYSLYDKVYALHNLRESFTKVKQNNGVAGVDGQSVAAFKENVEAELHQLFVELKTKRYRPKPVKRVYIQKEDGRKRPLGIPTVRDRVVQQALLNVLQPIFDPYFHPSSYGYRPNRSAARAVAKAERFSNHYVLSYVVDMDISKCFNSLDHKLILQGVNSRVADGSVLSLIDQFLKSGMIEDGKYRSTEVGCPQGGVISPLLMNIYLDSFDEYTKSLEIRIVRYADDILIFGKSRSETVKYRHLATQYLEQVLHLKINEAKTHLTDKWTGIAFLGFIITSGQVKINPKSIKKFKGKVRALTSRSGGRNLEMQVWYLNDLLRGFSSYFRIGNSTRDYKKVNELDTSPIVNEATMGVEKLARLTPAITPNGLSGQFPENLSALLA